MLFIIQIIYVYFVFKEDKLLLLFAYILWSIRDSTVKNHFRTDPKSLRHKNSEFTKIISQYIRDFPSRKGSTHLLVGLDLDSARKVFNHNRLIDN